MLANEVETDIIRQEVIRLVDELFPCNSFHQRRFCGDSIVTLSVDIDLKLNALATAALALAKGEAYIP